MQTPATGSSTIAKNRPLHLHQLVRLAKDVLEVLALDEPNDGDVVGKIESPKHAVLLANAADGDKVPAEYRDLVNAYFGALAEPAKK